MDLKFSGEYCLNEEGTYFEAKSAKGGIPLSMWESYSSFANSFGGTIALGLEETEDGALVVKGVKDPEKVVNEIWNTVNNQQKVSRNVLKADDVEIVEHNGKKLVTVSVARADRHDCPIYINDRIDGGTFRRNGSNDYRCTKPEIAGMMRDNTDLPLDASILNGFEMDDIDRGTLSRYRTLMRIGDENHIWNDVPDNEFLKLIGAAKKGEDGMMHPTLAGLLMFGQEYRIACEVPDYKLDYIEYMRSGVDWEYRIVSGDGKWTGNIFDFYTNAANRLGISVGRPFMIGNDWGRVEDTDVDKALRESLINALVHADYRGRMGVRIEVRPKLVIVRNPGLFRIPIREAEGGGYSDPRNPTLAKMFSLIGRMERAGSGLYRIIETWKKNGYETPTIEESLNPPTVKMVLSMKMDPKTSVFSEEEKILGLIAADDTISIERISKEIGISKSKAETRVRKLKESGRLERTGEKKNGHWVIK
ncbi:MAG: putative DNA binding domain-containing protein [Methanomassiliicoccaceae archaeon]|nr:putative DNA binding domain-containing protein [Methanomassiliicoccaceae archaeon]